MFDPSTIILKGEDAGFLPSLIDEARALFQPANGFEESMVDSLAILQYRQRRIARFEASLLSFQRILTPDMLIENWPGIDESGRNTLALTRMRSKIKDLLGLETSLARLFQQTLKSLEMVRKISKAGGFVTLRPAPEPAV